MTLHYKNIVWIPYHGALLPLTPPHQNITLSKAEQTKLLSSSKAYFLRWTDQFDIPEKKDFWYIIKDTPEGIETYTSKIRNQIKKGLKNCVVKPSTAQIIANEGYDVYLNAFQTYKIFHDPIPKEIFQKNITSLNESWEFWEVRNDAGDMIAYSQNLIMDDTCNYSTVKLDPDSLHLYPAYALFFTMNLHYLNELKMRYVHDGSRSLSHETNIQNFLCQKFKFRKAYCQMHVAYRFDIALVVKLLFPFRNIFNRYDFPFFKKISILLKHEEIRRNNDQ